MNEYFVFVIVFWLLFDKFPRVFQLCFKSNRYVCRRLISKILGVENDLNPVYVVVDYNTLTLLWAGNSLVRFSKSLLWTLLVFVAFD